ncbi:MAG: hypothetical protein WDN03_05630 [Rhizomicrobium sp.]
MVIASALAVPCTRTTAASPPGRCTVSAITVVSYCSHTQRREHMSGAARIVFSDSSTGRFASNAGFPAAAGASSNGRAYFGAASDSAVTGMSATTAPLCLTTSRCVSVVTPITAKSSSHFLKMRSASASRPGLSTASMRSWLSDSIMS